MSTALTPVPSATTEIVPAVNDDSRLVAMWLHGRPQTTVEAYSVDIARFLASVRKALQQISLLDIQTWLNTLTGANNSKRRALLAVKSLFSFAARLGYITLNPASLVKTPRADDKLAERILSESKVIAMIELEKDTRNHLMIELAYVAGIRVSELCALRWKDLQEHGDAGQITVTGKGAKVRSIVLPGELWVDLQAYRGSAADDMPVFASRKGKGHLDRVQVLRIVRAAGQRVGCRNVGPHHMRHCHASHSLQRGADLNLVSQTLGHGDLRVTGRYLHARPSDSSARYLAIGGGSPASRKRVQKPALGSLGAALVNLGATPTEALARLQGAGIEALAEYSDDLLRKVLTVVS